MENKSICSKYGVVHYWVGGKNSENANCIVFTHGMIADHTMFNKQVEYFSKEYKIITWDLPLHGKSRPYEGFSYNSVSNELKRILDEEKVGRAILVGQSMGGYICQEFAIQYPEKVRTFVAVDTNPFGHYYYSKWDRYILTKVCVMSSWFPYSILIKSIAKGATKTKYGYNNLYNSASKLSKNEILNIIDKTYTGLLEREETVKFDFPVLLVVGDNDTTGNIKKYNQKWSLRDGYPLKFITNAAHNSNVDNYEEFNNIVKKFIDNTV